MDLKDLRDKIIGEKAVHEQNKKSAENTVNELSKIYAKLGEEDITKLENRGLNIRGILNFDKDRMLSDKEYVETYKKNIASFLIKLKENIEGEFASTMNP